MSEEIEMRKSSEEEYIKSTIDGKLYIETLDLFSQKKVQDIINEFLDSDILKAIQERRKDKNEGKAVA